MKKPLVIAIASVSGGGKTTVVNALNNKMNLSKALYCDDYDFGEDRNEWNTDILVKDIKDLSAEDNTEYVLLDYPFAYENNKAASYIDYTVFIDTPLDIAMARRIIRDKKNEQFDELKKNLKYYYYKGRTAYLEMLDTIKPGSDFIVDGSLSVDEIVTEIKEKIEKLELI